jgi:hypothetical protein
MNGKRSIIKAIRNTVLVLLAGLSTALCVVVCINYSRDPGFRRATRIKRLGKIAIASQDYFKIYGKWPDSLNSLVSEARWNLLQTNDAWDNRIQYFPFVPAERRGKVMSYGADKKPGGVGSGADITCYFGPIEVPTGGQ